MSAKSIAKGMTVKLAGRFRKVHFVARGKGFVIVHAMHKGVVRPFLYRSDVVFAAK